VADAVALSVVMELGPLMTAIIMAGRSGSAFAAEIGTMKVNEEVDALDTMGLDSTRFLVMPKFVALLLMMPLLVTFASFCGDRGRHADRRHVRRPAGPSVSPRDAAAAHALACGAGTDQGRVLRGRDRVGRLPARLQTKSGAQGVGLSATSAVVSGSSSSSSSTRSSR